MKNRLIKNEGQVFTPPFIVNDMLDFMDYRGENILGKHILENSCGQGAFLIPIVQRYAAAFIEKNGNKPAELAADLGKYVHGIEKDEASHARCIEALNAAVSGLCATVKWDVSNGDALELSERYFSRMDYMVGNPPYVRVHNLDAAYDAVKRYAFCASGMTDLYLVFFEIGLKTLNKTGKMCLITPSSFLKSEAGAAFRNDIFRSRNLTAVIDLGHAQPFEKAATYTAITLFDNAVRDGFLKYYGYDERTNENVFVDTLAYDDLFIGGKMFLETKERLKTLKEIDAHYKNATRGKISVKNGFATLADKVFIGDFPFDEMQIPVLKASTGKRSRCLFPYTADGRALSEAKIRESHPVAYDYLLSKKDVLKNRALEKKGAWHLFGRSQALKDVKRDKVAVNQLIRDKDSLKINVVPRGCGVYGGLYVVSDERAEDIAAVLKSDEFVGYVKSLKNYKSGGYYTYSSEDLEKFLLYKLDAGAKKNAG